MTLRVGWKNPAGKWTRGDASVKLARANVKPGEWRELVGAVRVPEGVTELVVQLCANGQTDEAEAAWFDDVRVAKFGP